MQKKSFGPWITWAVVSLFYAFQYILRVMPSILMADLSKKFSLSPEGFGQFSGVYYLGYSLAHLPVGVILDRFGPKRTVPLFILLTVLGILPLLYADHWSFPIAGRILMGIGSSAAILSVFKVIQMTFEESKFSRILSLSVTIGLIGAIYGGGPIHLIKQALGYEAVLIGLCTVGVALAGAAFIAIPEMETQSRAGHLVSDIFSILKNSRIMSLCLMAGLMVGPLEGFADVWGTQFLRVVYHLDEAVAASLPSVIFLGMCIGGPVLCHFADWSRRHLQVILMSAFVMACVFGLLLTTSVGATLLTVLFSIVGVCCSYQVLMIYKVSTLAGREKTGLATAMSNMIIMTFGYFFHSTIGKIVGFGSYDSPWSLTLGISVIPFALLLSFIGLIVWMRLGQKVSK